MPTSQMPLWASQAVRSSMGLVVVKKCTGLLVLTPVTGKSALTGGDTCAGAERWG